MGKTKSTDKSTALATTTDDELALLEDLGDLGVTGHEEADAEDIKIPIRVLNFKGKNIGPVLPNVFVDTVTEETFDQIDCTILLYTKGRDFRYFSDAKNETVKVCRSFDRVTGRLGVDEDPKIDAAEWPNGERSCATCPHQQWTRIDGKAHRDCGEMVSVLAIDNESKTPFFFRLRSTALAPWKAYLNKHFFKKNKGRDIGVFVFSTIVSAAMEHKGNTSWAVPSFERGPMHTRADILDLSELAKRFRADLLDHVERADAVDLEPSRPSDDATNPADFQDDDSDAAAPAGGF